MKFEEYCKLDPRIEALFIEAKTTGDDWQKYCREHAWYGYGTVDDAHGFKTRLVPLVGMMRYDGPEELGTSDAYDCCYQTILDALPDCHGFNCGCKPDEEEIEEEEESL